MLDAILQWAAHAIHNIPLRIHTYKRTGWPKKLHISICLMLNWYSFVKSQPNFIFLADIHPNRFPTKQCMYCPQHLLHIATLPCRNNIVHFLCCLKMKFAHELCWQTTKQCQSIINITVTVKYSDLTWLVTAAFIKKFGGDLDQKWLDSTWGIPSRPSQLHIQGSVATVQRRSEHTSNSCVASYFSILHGDS